MWQPVVFLLLWYLDGDVTFKEHLGLASTGRDTQGSLDCAGLGQSE